MTLQEKLAAIKKESNAKDSPEVVAIKDQAVDALLESGIVDKVIKVGILLPDFILPDEKGHLISSKDLFAKGPLAISFYRGIW